MKKFYFEKGIMFFGLPIALIVLLGVLGNIQEIIFESGLFLAIVALIIPAAALSSLLYLMYDYNKKMQIKMKNQEDEE